MVAPVVVPPVEVVRGIALFHGIAEQPPYFLMLYAPFANIKPPIAMLVLTAVYWGCGLIGTIILCRSVRTLNVHQAVALVVAATACGANCWAFVLGQPSWLLVALYAVLISAWLDNKPIAAGAVLAFSTIKPQYPPAFALAAAANARWKIIGAAAAAFAILICVSAYILGGFNGLAYYVLLLKSIGLSASFSNDDYLMISARGPLTALLGATLAVPISSAIYVLSLAFVAWAWWHTDRATKPRTWTFAITVLCSLLFAPRVYRYDALLLVLCAALTLRSLRLFEQESDVRFAAWKYMLLAYPAITLVVHMLSLAEFVKSSVTFVLHAVLLILALLLWWNSPKCTAVPSQSPP